MPRDEKQKHIDPDKLVRALLGSVPDVAKKQFAEEHKYLKYQKDPVLFGEEVLKETYTEDIKRMMYSVRDYPVTVAMSSTGPGKCMEENERILLADGSFRKVKGLIGEHFEVISYEDRSIVNAFAFDNGEQEVFEVETFNGRKIIRTGNHPLCSGKLISEKGQPNKKRVLPTGWEKVSNLNVGDLVLVPSSIQELGHEEAPEDHIKLCAYLMGGSEVTQHITFTQKDGVIKDEFCDIVRRLSCCVFPKDDLTVHVIGKKGYRQNQENFILTLARRWGLFGVKSKDRKFPEWVFKLPDAQLALFINRLFSCDGWAHAAKRPTKYRIEIGYGSASERLIRDLEICTIRLGIRGTVFYNKVKYKDGYRDSWGWRVERTEEVAKFVERIGIFGKEEALNECYEIAKRSGKSNTSHWHKYDGDDRYHWEKVRSIRSLGLRKTVGITVPDGHTYLTSFVEHNTHGAAAISIWFYKCFPNSQVYTAAAPPEDNLKRLLWGEIAKKAHRNPDIFKDDNINVMNIARNEWSFLTGVTIPSTGTEEERISKFSGKHAPYLLFVLDEGDAIPDEVYHGIDGCMSGGFARLLIMFNPKREAGEAYRMTRDKTANVVHLTAFNHPNVITGRNIIPGAVSQEIILRRINEQTMALPPDQEPDNECFEVPDFLVGKVGFNNQNKPFPPLPAGWRRILENSFYYTVLGQYPVKGSNQLISKEWVNRARSNWDLYAAKYGEQPPKGVYPIIGLDVADLGDDWNASCKRYGNWIPRIDKWRGVDPTETAERVAQEAHDLHALIVNVDSIGVGAGVPHALRRLNVRAARIMVSEKPTEKPKDRKAEFNKLRDQLWWEVREWLRTETSAMLPPDEALIEELLIATYEERNGKIQVLPKESMKKVLRRSPDTAEALILTFAPKPPTPRLRMIEYK